MKITFRQQIAGRNASTLRRQLKNPGKRVQKIVDGEPTAAFVTILGTAKP